MSILFLNILEGATERKKHVLIKSERQITRLTWHECTNLSVSTSI